MISSLRLEEILRMPFATVLEPVLTKVAGPAQAAVIINHLSDMPGVYVTEDVLNLTPEQFLLKNKCGEICLKHLQNAFKELGLGEK